MSPLNRIDASGEGLSALRIDPRQRPSDRASGWTKLLFVALGVVAIAALAGWWYYRTTGVNIIAALSEKPVEVSLYSIPFRSKGERENIALIANGRIVSDVRVYVATKVSGQIVELRVEQGDDVEEGQVLARVEDTIYRAQRDAEQANLEQLQSRLKQLEAELERDLASVGEAESELAFREFDFNRLEKLHEEAGAYELEFVTSKSAFDSAKAALDRTRAAAESTRRSRSVFEAQIAAQRASLRLAQKRLDDCDIRAPITGVVLERNAQIGDFLAAEGGRGANANAQLVSIADMTRLRVEVDISERDVHRLAAGQKARITPDAAPEQSYGGEVMWVDPIGDYARAQVQTKVRILNPDRRLRVEGSAKVEFFGPATSSADSPGSTEEADRIWLPLDAVFIDPNSGVTQVFTVDDGKAAAHAVTLGVRTTKNVEVLSGLSPGMRIVAKGVEELSEGRRVRVIDPQGAP